jgi:hypothetical protein
MLSKAKKSEAATSEQARQQAADQEHAAFLAGEKELKGGLPKFEAWLDDRWASEGVTFVERLRAHLRQKRTALSLGSLRGTQSSRPGFTPSAGFTKPTITSFTAPDPAEVQTWLPLLEKADSIIKKRLRAPLMPGPNERDRKGNRILDTVFESRLAMVITASDPELAFYYMDVAEAITATVGLSTKDTPFVLVSDDQPTKKGTHVKKAFEENLRSGYPTDKTAGEQYMDARSKAYDTNRADFLETSEGEELPRGRRETATPLWNASDEGDYQGIMTPRSGRRYLGQAYERSSLAPQQTGGRSSVRPSQRYTNTADKARETLDLPFASGPSGSMAYALAAFDAAKPAGKNRELFAVSLAMYLVRNQHHSLFEALVPLRPKVTSRVEFYHWIAETVAKHGHKGLAKDIDELTDEFYPASSTSSTQTSSSGSKLLSNTSGS